MKKWNDFNLKRSTNLLKEIEEQTDRGAVLVITAWIEEQLRAALSTKFVDSDQSKKKAFEGNGPLSTFSAKIELAFLLGLISKQDYSDLTIIRKIRNEFAHTILNDDSDPLNFNNPHISDRCYSLKYITDEKFDSPRHSFLRNCVAIWADLELIVMEGNIS